MDLLRLVFAPFEVLREFIGDFTSLVRLSFSSRTALVAENLFLRKQLAFYQEREIRPRRLTNVARLCLALWSRFFDWKSALVVVKPATLIGWHRKAFRLFWKWKSRPGRPRIPLDLRQLIAQMVRENPTWGEERIASELWLKLGVRFSAYCESLLAPRKLPVRPAFAKLEHICPHPCPSSYRL